MTLILKPQFAKVTCFDRRERRYPVPLLAAVRKFFRGWRPPIDGKPGMVWEMYGQPLTMHMLEIADPELEDFGHRLNSDVLVMWPGFDPREARVVIPAVLALAECTDRYSFRPRYLDHFGKEPNPDGIMLVAHKEGQKGGIEIRRNPFQSVPAIKPRALRGSRHGWESLAPSQFRRFEGVSAPALHSSFKKWARARQDHGAKIRTEAQQDGAVLVTRVA